MKSIKTLVATLLMSVISHVSFASEGVTGAVATPLYVAKDVTVSTPAGSITLRAGTAVVMESPANYSSKSLTTGQTISLRVKYNIVVDKQTIVAAGSLGTGNITNVTKPKSFGREGKMEINVQSVQAVDGQQILLSGIPMTVEGDNRKGLAWGLAIGGALLTYGPGALIGLFIKGKPAELKAGTTINCSVASDSQVELSTN